MVVIYLFCFYLNNQNLNFKKAINVKNNIINKDYITGLYNKRYLDKIMFEEFLCNEVNSYMIAIGIDDFDILRFNFSGIDTTDLSKIKFVTYGENCRYIKPSLKYYQEIISTLGIENESLMMVGNDVEEDMVAAKLNLKTYLIKDNLISRFHNEASFINQGSSEEFLEFIKRREYDNL